MTKNELREALDNSHSSREKRMRMVAAMVEKPHLIPMLMELINEVSDPISSKAFRVLEYLALKNIHYVLYNIDDFIRIIPKLQLESSIRPASKISMLLIENRYSKKSPKSLKSLSDTHLNAITESAFDWLMGNHKVAPKAYSMSILLLLGRERAWIHPELQELLCQNYESGSPAYKARARITLKSLTKNKSN